MSDYVSNTSLADVAAFLGEAKRVWMTSHERVDGDALGSLVALGMALQSQGKEVTCVIVGEVPDALSWLKGRVGLHVVKDELDVSLDPDLYDAVVVVDTGAWSQLQTLQKWIEPCYEKAVVIDHHRNGDQVGERMVVEPETAACAEIVAWLIDLLGVEINVPMGEAIYAGISTDTGSFRYSNTTFSTHELAARLIGIGVDHAALVEILEQQERRQKLALISRGLNSLFYHFEGEVALMQLSEKDFEATGANYFETDGLVNMPLTVKEVRMSVLMVEREGQIKFSLRSKPGDNALDVSKIANAIGGGGHQRAAGARFQGSLKEAEAKLVETIASLSY